MDFHIDRRVILSEVSEYKNLYEWSLREIDGDGKQVGRDLIPWDWSVSFTARDLVLADTLTLSSATPVNSRDDGDPNTKREAKKRQSIRATLRPLDLEPYSQTGFSMFGTARALSKFELFIYELQEVDGEERCVAWGSVSYTSEIDFREDTTDDVLVFNLFVRPDRFARYAERIASTTVDEVVFRVQGVAGFYSDWSPSITADSIKVLTNSEEHKIQIPADSTVKPPRLGEVAEAELHFHRIIRLERTETKETDDDEEPVVEPPLEEPDTSWEREEPIPASSPVHEGPLKVMDERVVKLLSSLRFAAWGIAFLLLLLLFK
ncbi:hypothetical protein [Ensifer adhaerens]